MEKRTSERQSAVQDVVVGYRNLGLVKGRTLDISLGGMCIDTGTTRLPVDAPVTVNFRIETATESLDCEAHAIVVRQTDSNCCLMFDGMNEKTHQALRSLVGDWHILPGLPGASHVAAF